MTKSDNTLAYGHTTLAIAVKSFILQARGFIRDANLYNFFRVSFTLVNNKLECLSLKKLVAWLGSEPTLRVEHKRVHNIITNFRRGKKRMFMTNAPAYS